MENRMNNGSSQSVCISVIIPCLNEEETLPILYREISSVGEKIREKFATLQLIFIDDGSTDHTLEMIKTFSMSDERVNYISLSRNFGKDAAIYAGMKAASGDYLVVMDADLQDPPELILEMFTEVSTGSCDCVIARRINREGEPKIRSLCARLYYKLIKRISSIDLADGTRDFRLMTRQMVLAILDLTEINRFTKGIFGWVGFKNRWIEYVNVERAAGQSKWTFWKLFIYSLEGIFSFSTLPLTLASFGGLLFFAIALLLVGLIIFRTMVYGDPVAGWPSLACIIFTTSGLQLFTVGILGQYLQKVYLETKKRPVFIVKECKVPDIS